MMRKKLFWWLTLVLIVLILILSFENIGVSDTVGILFFDSTLSLFFLIFFSSVLGFLVGFFSMLYAFEVRQEKELEEQSEAISSAPAKQVEEQPTSEKAPEKNEVKSVDDFDEDDEVLG